MKRFSAIILRDLRLAFRAGGGTWPSLVFFALIILDFALAIGPDIRLLSRIGAPLLWASALFGVLVSIDRIFQADLEDGSLEILIATTEYLSLTVLAKAIAHWLGVGLPMTLMAGMLGLLVGLDTMAFGPLLLSLAIGTPALSLVAVLGAAVTASLKRAGILASLLVAPLYTPIVIFGVEIARTDAVSGTGAGFPLPALMMLAANTLFMLILAPIAAAHALRFGQN